jgi:hypothetical protein
MKEKISIGLVILVFISLVIYFINIDVPTPTNLSEDLVDSAIKKLQSSDESERQMAKEALLQMGPSAIKPLIDYLTYVIRKAGTIYATGKSKQDFDNIRETYSNNTTTFDEKIKASKAGGDIIINQRLEEDVCKLLGRLQAEDAIPILIEAMEHEPSESLKWENMNPAMEALINMGSASIPRVIEAMETAESRESAVRYADGALPSEYRIKTISVRHQARAIMVLGEIGNAQSLSVLEKLQSTTESNFLFPYLKDAIDNIKKKNNLK